jgi:type I restriction enzyme R subunit
VTPLKSPNFGFLAAHDPLLVKLAAQAERFCFDEPGLSLVRLRQLTEAMAMEAVAATGGFPKEAAELDLLAAIRLLEQRNAMGRETAQVFHHLRQSGNRAVHEDFGSQRDALHALKLALHAATWFHRTLGKPDFKARAFVPPPEPQNAEVALANELEELRTKLGAATNEAQAATSTAAEQAELRRKAEADAAKAYADLQAALDLAEESEAKLEAARVEFTAVMQNAPAALAAQVKQTLTFATQADAALSKELDEADTRLLIDAQLREAGWEVDSAALRYALGARPEHGKRKAIAEWPTASGPVDYVLFVGLVAVGVVEAKKHAKDIPGVLAQAKRYARDLHLNGHGAPPAGGPWGDFRVPFMFATNGRPYLRQLETKSGIWFLDGRQNTNLPRPLNGWWTPDGLLELLKLDAPKADAELRETPVDLPGLYYYQIEAIEMVEKAIAEGRRDILLAMATGTGKTRTCLSLLYRVVRARRFRRVLFLVDRTELGIQAGDAFRDVKLEGLQSFSEIYEVKEIGDVRLDAETRVHISTVQGMVKRLLFPEEGAPPFPVDAYDCVVVDECHRGYILDRELSEKEVGFVSEQDYQSKYRRVLDHFDAVRIGLTATPALHTSEIFGKPIYTYSYRQAVIDGYLIDHEPPHRLITDLNQEGINWKVGEEVKRLNPTTGKIDLSNTPDEIKMDVEKFNSEVITEPFNKTVCDELARHLDPRLPGKTLIFTVKDDHADLVVKLLGEALAARYGPLHQDTVAKITGASDKPSLLVRRFKNEELPKIGVTVDLLTTGIDVPAIVNIVFIRRVKSRILYEQMLGRATRLCRDLFGPGEDKEVFHIFDAVDLYGTLQNFTDMKPVVTDPQLSIRQIVEALIAAKGDPESRQHFHEELLAKLNRKRSLLREHEEQLKFRIKQDAKAFLAGLRKGGSATSIKLFTDFPGLADFLDSLRKTGARPGILISDHPDKLRGVERGYGAAKKPEDYLESFAAWIRDNLNKIPALLVLTQRPRDLTRAQLKEVALALDEAGFSYQNVRTAWREARNEDIAAGIIGFIRAQALGSPLVPYDERVDRAMRRILATKRYAWTAPQRKWLERIAKQLKKEVVVDRTALNEGRFRDVGGFDAINSTFDGKLAELLADVQEEIWKESA